MRKVIFVGFLAFGVLVGLLWSWNDGWGAKIVLTSIGAVTGAAVGGGLSRLGQKVGEGGSPVRFAQSSDIPGALGTSPDDLSANFWRDKGLPPFVKGRDAEPDKHMFDPDNIGP